VCVIVSVLERGRDSAQHDAYLFAKMKNNFEKKEFKNVLNILY
jgi:hypothetical protein